LRQGHGLRSFAHAPSRDAEPVAEHNNNGLGMEIRSWPAAQRAQRYQGQAGKLRLMAEAEPVEKMRALLLVLAAQYQELADSLKAGRPFIEAP
jgi:hypothetical protein